MSAQNVKVRVWFKGADGPTGGGAHSYIFEQDEFKRLKEDFLRAMGGLEPYGGAYKCNIEYVNLSDRHKNGPTELILRFSDVMYIG